MRYFLILASLADSSQPEVIEFAASADRDAAGHGHARNGVLAAGLNVEGTTAREVSFPIRPDESPAVDGDNVPADDLPAETLRATARTRRSIKRAEKAFYLMELFPEGATILAAYGDGEQDTGYAAAVDYADSIADGETVVLGLDVDRDGGLAVERLEQHE